MGHKNKELYGKTLLGTNISLMKLALLKMTISFPKVGYVNSLEGKYLKKTSERPIFLKATLTAFRGLQVDGTATATGCFPGTP